MHILLIGGTGVLSKAVALEAIKKGYEVTVINRGNRPIPDGVKLLRADKDDKSLISSYLDGKHYDAIVDFLCFSAQDVDVSFSFYSKYTSQYFFISSCAVYNTSVSKYCSEDSPKVLDIWPYSIGKWNAEQEFVRIAKQSSCKYTIVRPAVTYDDTRIPYGISPKYGYHWTLAARILSGKPLIRWNNGENIYSMMRVEDFAVGLVGLIGNEKAYNEAFNIAGDECPSFNEVIGQVEEYLGVKAKYVDIDKDFYAREIPDRAGELLGGRCLDGIISTEKLKNAVPYYKQSIQLKDGVRKTLDAYKLQNFQQGIDWDFDAQTDRIVLKWCKKQSIPTKQFNLSFVDYLGTATCKDRYAYYNIVYHDELLMKIIRKVVKVHRLINVYLR